MSASRLSKMAVLWRPCWIIGMAGTLGLIGIATILGPTERVLGAALRLVLLHGAWVWVGKATYALAGLVGLAFLLLRRSAWAGLSQALAWTALLFWSTYLPMSLYLQLRIWGGVFWEEPRWRVPLMLWGVSLLLQAAVWLMREPRLAAAVNAGFGGLLWWQLGRTGTVLHPQSPIFGGDALHIQLHFIVLVLLCSGLMVQVVILLWPHARRLFYPA
ncbi:hypothetical protein [uncultured Thermanaerothrix sp.]|uniref:hypothetical protein n=1 Tax=uncultured Thermanaerothrix sp. TaxID=1195149 RepID=UPI0026036AEA|nr:hypothetical protein [uncultured Thermanaerothrix sp.]